MVVQEKWKVLQEDFSRVRKNEKLVSKTCNQMRMELAICSRKIKALDYPETIANLFWYE